MFHSMGIGARALLLSLALLLGSTMPGNDAHAGWFWPESVTDAPEILEKTIRELLSSSTRWQEALRLTIDKLTREGHAIVAHDVSRVLQDTTADIGIEGRCFVDFLRRRVIEDLKRIKSALDGTATQLVPAFCNPNPTVIDALGVRNGHVLSLDVSGYNLHLASLLRDGRITVNHVQNGSPQDVTAHLSNPSPYLLTLNLSPNGVRISSRSDRLEFDLDGVEQSVTIVQPPPTTETLTPADLLDICPQRYGSGDKEFKGHGPVVIAEAQLSFDDRTVWVDYFYDVYEAYPDFRRRHDHTAARTRGRHAIFNAPPGAQIIDVEPKEKSRIEYFDRNHQEDLRPGGRLVRLFETNGDTKGDDVGNCKGRQDAYFGLYFNSVHITHRERF